MLRILGLTIVVFGFMLALVYLLGYTTNERHQGSMTSIFDDNQTVLWDVLISTDNIQKKRPKVVDVEILSNNRGLISWKETDKNGSFRMYSMLERTTPKKLVLEVNASNGGPSGKLTYELFTAQTGTRIVLTEDVKTKSLFIRGLNRIQGDDINLIREMKSIRVALFQRLLNAR